MTESKIILGYAGPNHTLREEHVVLSRTCRLSVALQKGVPYLEDLFFRNLSDVLKTLQWNAQNKIRFYRIPSDIAPHITNEELLEPEARGDFRALAYPLEKFEKEFKRLGDFAKDNQIRLTFHPNLYAVLNSPNDHLTLRTFRDLYFQARIFDLMGLDDNSVLVLHGGGIYQDKKSSMKKWVENFRKLPALIQRRVVLENDETNFNAEDVLSMANQVGVPVVFDVFHYYCYNQTIIRRGWTDVQLPISRLLPLVLKTWGERQMKIHLSEQAINGPFGAHSEFVHVIPTEIIEFVRKQKIVLYLMVEARAHEEAVLFLRKKYPEICQ